MKKKKFILVALCCCFLFLLSCQDEPGARPSEKIDPNLEIAQKNLDDFIKFNKAQNTKSFGSELTITGVTKKSLPLKVKDSLLMIPQTRSAIVEMKDSADLYTFTFMKDGHKGYAIVSGNERVSKLYAYVEKGDPSDAEINYGLKQTLEMVDNTYQDDVVGAYITGNNETKSPTSTYAGARNSGPFTNLDWGQGKPYNKLSPLECSSGSGGKAPAGCVPVALAMAIAYMEPMIGEHASVLPRLNKQARIYEDDPDADVVANYIGDIGIISNTKYTCAAGSTTAEDASKPLSHYFVIHQLEHSMNDNWTKNTLNDGFPIIVFGGRHCWLFEGGKTNSSGTYTHFYINWGYDGYNNGLFIKSSNYTYTNPHGASTTFNTEKFIYIFDVAKLPK